MSDIHEGPAYGRPDNVYPLPAVRHLPPGSPSRDEAFCRGLRDARGKRPQCGTRRDPQLRHLDHAWASTVHAFQGRTVDNVIAAMEARHPHLTTQKSFYVEISRARDRAELVTDDAAELRAQLQTVTGERIAALEGIGEMEREGRSGKSPRAWSWSSDGGWPGTVQGFRTGTVRGE